MVEKKRSLGAKVVKIIFVGIILYCISFLWYSILGPKIANLLYKDEINYRVFEFRNEYDIKLGEKFAIYNDYEVQKLLCTGWQKRIPGRYREKINYNKNELNVEELILKQGCFLNYYYLCTPKETGRIVITEILSCPPERYEYDLIINVYK